MHYGACFFSMCPTVPAPNPNCRTITVLSPNDTYWQTRIGQRDHLSQWDKLIMSFIYSYSNDRFVDWLFPAWFGSADVLLSLCGRWAARRPALPDGGYVLDLRSGYYSVGATHSKPMTISAPIGGVTLGL